ncbi:1483_t:CDS:2, partial [Cetraspora pellucida]
LTVGPIMNKSSLGYRAHYICSLCFQKQDGHLYERLHRNNLIMLCTELERHQNDTNDTLIDIRSEVSQVHLPSSLLIKTAIKMAKIDPNKLIEKYLKITSEKGNNYSKFKYASSVVHFLVQVHDDPQFQKLLETQNIFGNLIDQETIMQKIKAVQCERDYSLWSLVTKLISEFKVQDKYELFKDMPKINKKDFKKIFACYELGKLHLEAILKQDYIKQSDM